MEVLLDKSKSAIEADIIKKEINNIGKELKEKYPDEKYPTWMKRYIHLFVYGGKNQKESAEILGIGRSTAIDNIDDNIKEYIDDKKSVQITHIGHKLYNLADKSIKSLEELISDPDTQDATKLRAVEMILKYLNVVTDKQQVEHSGEVKTPIKIIFTSDVPNES